MFRKDRLVKPGVGLCYIQAYDFSEAIWCNLESQGSKSIVGVVCRCPSISKDEDTSCYTQIITQVSSGACQPDTSAVLRLECSIDCISGSVGHQQFYINRSSDHTHYTQTFKRIR